MSAAEPPRAPAARKLFVAARERILVALSARQTEVVGKGALLAQLAKQTKSMTKEDIEDLGDDGPDKLMADANALVVKFDLLTVAVKAMKKGDLIELDAKLVVLSTALEDLRQRFIDLVDTSGTIKEISGQKKGSAGQIVYH